MANKDTKQEKKITLSSIKEELDQLRDLASAVNARCFYLREELKLMEAKTKNHGNISKPSKPN